ncbi:hypothetical protein DKX38_003099 [Salix brachista]|uniref:Uncharacterized protein n=1 Tax=Salix brachista TaxID=2182728 RepID=A0A5N5NSE3_9ROSI|nr:hypothetical protein DKX38_003099 [Salix brachista]
MILRSESGQSLNFSMPNAGINGVKFELSWKQSLNMNNLILHLTASHTTDYQHPMLIFNTLVVIVLVAKFPNMHEVRIFGINADK